MNLFVALLELKGILTADEAEKMLAVFNGIQPSNYDQAKLSVAMGLDSPDYTEAKMVETLKTKRAKSARTIAK